MKFHEAEAHSLNQEDLHKYIHLDGGHENTWLYEI